MNNKVYHRKALKRFRNRIKRARLKQLRRRNRSVNYQKVIENLGRSFSPEQYFNKTLTPIIKYLVFGENSCFSLEKLKQCSVPYYGKYIVPKQFSIIDRPKESFEFLQILLAGLLLQPHDVISLDYSKCESVDLGAQVLLDILLKDGIEFYKKCRSNGIPVRVKKIDAINIYNKNIGKMLFSVGSPATIKNRVLHFKDIIPYRLCIHNRAKYDDILKIREQKDIDTTTLVDYVLACLNRLNLKLSPEKLDNLCTVIGEILINAEEHSTTKYRFSIGYFHEVNNSDSHYGIFRLAILNFGETIYEKFKSDRCGNIEMQKRMIELSSKYKKRNLFSKSQFEEETLWTLYALQDGVTSISPEKYPKRGHGSIQFIENFFNIKGPKIEGDKISRMSIFSGHAMITFDGSYEIATREIDGDQYKVMAFNKQKNIEEPPDKKYVKFVENYFPGTIISAKILFNENDVKVEV